MLGDLFIYCPALALNGSDVKPFSAQVHVLSVQDLWNPLNLNIFYFLDTFSPKKIAQLKFISI